MSLTLLMPRYSHPRVSADEKAARGIADMMSQGEDPIPQKCACGAVGTAHSPLMARPTFTMPGTLRPRGTLYTVFCANCWLKECRAR